MKRLAITTFALFFSISPLLPISSVFAVEDTFDPNFIISDAELQDWQSMDRPAIQAFLEDRDSYLSTFRTEDIDGTRRLASDIIYRSAVDNKINPKYLLVKLQKEQSLITEDDPTQKQLDGATGYGITDGCGWSCQTYFDNKGFGNQVQAAAGIMRWYYDNVSSKNWIKRPPLSYDIDGQFITPQTYATAFLYTYTPHIQGNKNFWTLWQSWFDQVYPDGTLLKALSGSDVYIIQDGKKRKFASMTALATRYDPNHVITVPSSELTRYDSGPAISLPNYSVVKSGSEYYLLDYDTKRKFESSNTVSDLGYYPDEILDVSSADLSSYNTGSTITSGNSNPLGKIIQLQENDALYYLQENQYFPIYDKAILKTNFSHLSLESATIAKLKGLVQGPPVRIKEGTLILVEGDNKVYVIENEKKRHIASEEVFNGLGYTWANIVTVNEFTGIAHETAESVYLRKGVTTLADVAPKIEEEQIVADLMLRTPEDEWTFVGPTFETDVDSYLVAEYASGDILAGKNINTVRSTASLAKVVSAYRAVKEGLNLDGSVTYNDAKHGMTDPDFIGYRLVDGERVRNRDILDAALVSSVNPAPRMLASSVSDEASFIVRINEQFDTWGLTKSKFIDVFGGSEKNVTTAKEFLTIFKHATANSTIRASMGKISYQYNEMIDIDGLPKHAGTHTNTLMTESGLSFRVLASKTGYLYEAGDNLAMLVERLADGKKFVILTLGNVDHKNKFSEPKALTQWAMNTF